MPTSQKDNVQDPASLRELHLRDKLNGLEQLAAGIAHELRNPLSTLGTSVYYLSQVLGVQDNQSVHEHLEIMQSEIERSQRVISNLVDFSRRSNGERQKADVNQLLEQTLSLLDKNLRSQNVEIRLQLSALPSCFVSIDDIKQVFLQLLINAVEAMPEGGNLTLESFVYDEETAGFRITDSGMGIADDHLNHIFDPFYSMDKHDNIGLGLSLVHASLKRNAGKVTVSSAVGQGTEFTVYLPLYLEANHVN